MTKIIRKIAAFAASMALMASLCLGLFACAGNGEKLMFYMPDGAPALSCAYLMNGEAEIGADISYNVVDSSLIQTYVTGTNPKADICLLPVNQAGQLLGSGETYTLLGVATHGNLFLATKSGQDKVTPENIDILAGKSVGVVNLAAVPGGTFKMILENYGLEYAEKQDESISEGIVNLYAMSAASDMTAYDYDYYVVPEPAFSTMSASNDRIEYAGSLQELYGGDDGYPQAVLVAKNSVIQENPGLVDILTGAMVAGAEWLKGADAGVVCAAVRANLSDGLSPTFTEANLTAEVIENCAVYFTTAAESKEEILGYLEGFWAVQGLSYTLMDVSDSFFYGA